MNNSYYNNKDNNKEQSEFFNFNIFIISILILVILVTKVNHVLAQGYIPLPPLYEVNQYFSSSSYPICFLPNLLDYENLHQFARSFANKSNKDILRAMLQVDVSDFLTSTKTYLKEKKIRNSNEVIIDLFNKKLFNLQNGSLKVNTFLVCQIRAQGKGPFCSGPIYTRDSSSNLKGELSIFIPINGYAKIAGTNFPINYRLNLYRVETQSKTDSFAFAVD
ncbi:MAG: hypothetical protein KatS3mg095_0557 [Candidatus Parcubacteria bacterium]|nr:MAG: hypothetical protein KatS3mg095_0557 [Candidatus Parcubacteria bacterium]